LTACLLPAAAMQHSMQEVEAGSCMLEFAGKSNRFRELSHLIFGIFI
jgi:hypothetical protein